MIKVPTCMKKSMFLWAIEEQTASFDEIDKQNVFFFFFSFTVFATLVLNFHPRLIFQSWTHPSTFIKRFIQIFIGM